MKINLISASALVLLGACTATAGSDGVRQVGGDLAVVAVEETKNIVCIGEAAAQTALCRGLDIGARFLGEGSTEDTLTYTETDDFDESLYASMKGNVPNIEIKFDGNAPSVNDVISVPEQPLNSATQIVHWQAKVLNSGGKIAVCEARSEEFLGTIASILIDRIFGYLNEWETYRFAKNYNSILVVSEADENEQRTLLGAHYRLRSDASETTCPNGSVGIAEYAR